MPCLSCHAMLVMPSCHTCHAMISRPGRPIYLGAILLAILYGSMAITILDRLPNITNITKDQVALRVMYETQGKETQKYQDEQEKKGLSKKRTKTGPTFYDWIFGRDNKNDQKETQPETKCELVLMEQMPYLFFPKSRKPMEEILKSINFAVLNHFKNTGSDISKNQKSQAAFIRALLDISKEEGKRLGVAKTVIFEPPAAYFSLSSRYGSHRGARKVGQAERY
jgi:hypothetical protein